MFSRLARRPTTISASSSLRKLEYGKWSSYTGLSGQKSRCISTPFIIVGELNLPMREKRKAEVISVHLRDFHKWMAEQVFFLEKLLSRHLLQGSCVGRGRSRESPFFLCNNSAGVFRNTRGLPAQVWKASFIPEPRQVQALMRRQGLFETRKRRLG